MYGSYNTSDYSGFASEIEGRHQDYLNRVATAQQRNIAKKTQDLIDAQSIFQQGKAIKTQGSEFLAGDIPAAVGLYKGLQKVRPAVKAAKDYVEKVKSGLSTAKDYVESMKGKAQELADEVKDRLGNGAPEDSGVEMSNVGEEESKEAEAPTPARKGFGADTIDENPTNPFARTPRPYNFPSKDEEIGEPALGAEEEEDLGEAGKSIITTAGEEAKTAVTAAGEEAEAAVSTGLEDVLGGVAETLAGPLGFILGGVGLYEGIKEFVDGTADETTGTKDRLAAEAENVRPNIPNPDYSGKFVAPVPNVI